jgi:hypothetical protein
MRNLIAAFAVAAALAGCTASSVNTTTAAKIGAIDYANDDVGSMLIAFDVPVTLEPVLNGSKMIFTLGDRTLTAVLARADLDEVAGTLPPPEANRTYYLFGFSEADKQKIQNLQHDAQVIPAGTTSLTVALSPLFCRTEEIDAAKTRFSVLLGLPGSAGKLEPLIKNSTLEAALATMPEKELPLCEGHSG